MSGIETTISVLELVKWVKTCADFYQEARLNTPQANQELRLRLEVEAITFERWCVSVGLRPIVLTEATTTDFSSGRTSRDLEVVQSCLVEHLRFNSTLTAELVISVLKGLSAKFEAARDRLGVGQRTRDGATSSQTAVRWKIWSRPNTKANDQTVAQRGAIGIFGASKWLLWDKKYFMQLLDELTSVNESLIRLLDAPSRVQIQRQINLQILNTTGCAVLPTAQSLCVERPTDGLVSILAELRQMNISEDSEDEHDTEQQLSFSTPTETGSHVPTYNVQDFEPDITRSRGDRTIAEMQKRPFVVEWKYFGGSSELRFQQILRLGSLVTLLSRQDIYKSFHIPRCVGYVTDDTHSRVGLVFNAPVANSAGPVELETLYEVISNTRETPMPSNTDRLAIAVRLSTAVHYLHSVHWFHKSLRSDNVVCFQVKQNSTNRSFGQDEGNTPIGNVHPADGQQRGNDKLTFLDNAEQPVHLPDFYLLGLDLSRPDHESEMSESLSTSALTYQRAKENVKLYTHPEASKVNVLGKKTRYEARFDIYSLGLVLLEIGLWRTLHDINKTVSRRKLDYHEQIRNKYCHQLRSTMGDIYWRVVRRCLHTDFDLSDTPPNTQPGLALQLAFEKQALSELERCVV